MGVKKLRKSPFFILGIVFLTFSLSSCAGLRKKFIRKKKTKVHEVEPVLNPIDYPPPQYIPEQTYRRHYSLWKVWARDMDEALARGDYDKRINYILSQYLLHLGKMKDCLAPEGQAGLQALIEEAQRINAEFQKPEPMRNSGQLSRDVKRLSSKIRNQFNSGMELPYTDK